MLCALLFGGFPRAVRAQTAPYDSNFGRAYHERLPEHSYPADFRKIEDVDFGNQPIVVFTGNPRLNLRAKLRDGFWEERDDSGYQSIQLDSVDYYRAAESDGNIALVFYTWFAAGGSSNSNGIAQVVKLAGRELTVVQQIDWDEHFYTKSAFSSFDPKTKTLVIRSAHYLPGDAHCCVSAMDVVTLRWNGTRFVQSAMKTEPTQHAIDNGKQTPPTQSGDH